MFPGNGVISLIVLWERTFSSQNFNAMRGFKTTLLLFCLALGTTLYLKAGDIQDPDVPDQKIEEQTHVSPLSAQSQQFLNQYQKVREQAAKKEMSMEKSLFPDQTHENIRAIQNNQVMVSGLLKGVETFDPEKLEKVEAKTTFNAGDIYGIKLPAVQLNHLEELRGVERFEIDGKMEPTIDTAREMTGAKPVHKGYQELPPLKGEDVLIGMVDVDIEADHPSFKDSTGENLRIKSVWDLDHEEGTPPEGYDVGTEIMGENEILEWSYDTDDMSHGNMVANIAAGSSVLAEGKYRGIAPKADIIYVHSMEYTPSDLLKYVEYMFEVAEEKGRPIAVNLSVAIQNTPPDGSDLFSQALGEVTAPGKIVVSAAGNEAEHPIHISNTPENREEVSRTFIQHPVPFEPEEMDYENGFSEIMVSGSPDDDLEVFLQVWDMEGELVKETPVIPYQSDFDTVFTYEGIGMTEIDISGESNPDSRPFVNIDIIDMKDETFVELGIKGAAEEVHAWNYMGALTNISPVDGPLKDRISGDNEISIAPSAAGKSVITAGAFSRDGSLGSFSSRGPTLDGRTKPDITALGEDIVAAITSQFDESEPGAEELEVVDRVNYEGQEWRFSETLGTSFAAPQVAGAIALMLEENPNLTTKEAKEMLTDYAKIDEHTGEIPEEGSNQWGWGKLDIAASITEGETVTELNEKQVQLKQNISLYPNPAEESFKIQYNNAEVGEVKELNIQLQNLSGQVVSDKDIALGTDGKAEAVNISELPEGMYIASIEAPAFRAREKLIVR